MDRKTGTAAIFLLAAGVSYRGGVPGGAAQTRSGQEAATSAVSAAGTLGNSSEPGPWRTVCEYLRRAEPPEAAPSLAEVEVNIQGDVGKGTLRSKMHLATPERSQAISTNTLFCVEPAGETQWQRRTILATVPDPELTHLALGFDRAVESIAWAVTDGDGDQERYTFDSYWFPWRAELGEETDPEKRKAAERDRDERLSKPGLMLFRGRENPRRLLLVFLVGETPTSGINRAAFRKAWRYAKDLKNQELPMCGGEACLGVLGPNFSGSMPSLDLLLGEVGEEKTQVVSGSVTAAPQEPLPISKASFHTTRETLQNSKKQLFTYLEWLRSGEEISKRFAFLVEDDTAYGGKLQPSDGLMLRYPRGIASIRNSTAELPGLGSAGQPNARYPGLSLDLRDKGKELIPSFARQQSPVSQEAVLFEIAATLRRERTRYVGIVATDVLDALFLSRFLRAAAPDARIVLFTADLLFGRAAESWGLEGTLAVSSYPALLRDQIQGGPRHPARIPFSSDIAEGIYNACRRMLLAGPPEEAPRAFPAPPTGDLLLDYDSPPTTHKPPAWISILGREGWWPVAAMPPTEPSPLLAGPTPATPGSGTAEGTAPRLWLVFFWAVWAAAAAHVLLMAGLNTGYRHWLWKHPRLRTLGWGFNPDFEPRRRALLAGSALVVAATCWVLAAVAFSGWRNACWWPLQPWLALALGAVCLLEALWAAWPVPVLPTTWPFSVRWMVVAGAVLEIGSATAWLVTTTRIAGRALEFSGYRAVHLESGVSPLPPLLLTLLAVHLFCWCRLSQLRMREDRGVVPPQVPGIQGVPPPPPPLNRWNVMWCAAALGCWLLVFDPYDALATPEAPIYDGIVLMLCGLLIVLLALSISRLLEGWDYLKKVLQALERHPIRYAFTRLPKDFSWTTVWSGDPRPRLLTEARMLDVLRKIPQGQGQVKGVATNLAALSDAELPLEDSYCYVKDLDAELNAATAPIVAACGPAWLEGISDSVAAREKQDAVPPEWEKDPQRFAREEFLALRYVAFLRYGLLQLRVYLEFLMYGFILMAAALNLYPFAGRYEIGVMLVVIFVVLGVCAITVFTKMDRDPLLSRLSNTKANELDLNFVYRMASFGALPLLTLLASVVPGAGSFLLSWLQPALQAVK